MKRIIIAVLITVVYINCTPPPFATNIQKTIPIVIRDYKDGVPIIDTIQYVPLKKRFFKRDTLSLTIGDTLF
jgi:hypothetical protein